MTIDHKKARKEYRKLKVPDNYFNPCACPIENNKYFTIVTERKSGKTTNVMLYGLVCNKLFGTTVVYIKQTDAMLAPKNARDLMGTIIGCGYVPKLTDGKYNTLVYKSRRWYYAKTENGEITETAPEPCVVCLSVDNSEIYKSSMNLPNGDFIVFDEFCTRRHLVDEFVLFCDILSTVIRSRCDGVTIWMLGNVIDPYEYYFDELEIADYIKYMSPGEHMEIKTSKGTPIYIEIYQPHITTLKEKVNQLFFGFTNSKLNAITGDGWLIVPYQHIDKEDVRELIDDSHFIIYEKNLVQLDVCFSEKYGLHVVAHKSTNYDKRAVYYTCDTVHDIRYRFRFGHSKADRMIWTLYDRKKFFFATNSDAAIVQKYVALADKISA